MFLITMTATIVTSVSLAQACLDHRSQRDGCPSIHHLPCTVAWPENVRSDETWEIELINSDEKNKTQGGEDCERSRGEDM